MAHKSHKSMLTLYVSQNLMYLLLFNTFLGFTKFSFKLKCNSEQLTQLLQKTQSDNACRQHQPLTNMTTTTPFENCCKLILLFKTILIWWSVPTHTLKHLCCKQGGKQELRMTLEKQSLISREFFYVSTLHSSPTSWPRPHICHISVREDCNRSETNLS